MFSRARSTYTDVYCLVVFSSDGRGRLSATTVKCALKTIAPVARACRAKRYAWKIMETRERERVFRLEIGPVDGHELIFTRWGRFDERILPEMVRSVVIFYAKQPRRERASRCQMLQRRWRLRCPTGDPPRQIIELSRARLDDSIGFWVATGRYTVRAISIFLFSYIACLVRWFRTTLGFASSLVRSLTRSR